MAKLTDPEVHDFIVKHQADITRVEMRKMLEEKYGIVLSANHMNRYMMKHKLRSNEPRKQKHKIGDRILHGTPPYSYTKVGLPSKWKLTHRLLWESVHGEIPEGKVVIFLDNDRTNITIDNLACLDMGAVIYGNHFYDLSTGDGLLTKVSRMTSILDYSTK